MSKQGFFFPTVAIYILLFFSFLIWQMSTVIQLELMVKASEYQVQKESNILLVKQELAKNNNFIKHTQCLSPLPNNNTLLNKDNYKVTSTTICMKKPEVNDIVLGKEPFILFVQQLKLIDAVVSPATFESTYAELISLYQVQRMLDWVGLVIDDPIDEEEINQMTAIAQLDPYLITTITFKSEEIKREALVFYDIEDDEYEKIIYEKGH